MTKRNHLSLVLISVPVSMSLEEKMFLNISWNISFIFRLSRPAVMGSGSNSSIKTAVSKWGYSVNRKQHNMNDIRMHPPSVTKSGHVSNIWLSDTWWSRKSETIQALAEWCGRWHYFQLVKTWAAKQHESLNVSLMAVSWVISGLKLREEIGGKNYMDSLPGALTLHA